MYLVYFTALIHVCVYCGVKFSSPRTLQAHIANYCSRKPCPVSTATSVSMTTVPFTHQQLVRPGVPQPPVIFPPSVSMSLGALNPLTAAAAFAAALNRLPAFQTSQSFAPPPPPPVGSWSLPVAAVERGNDCKSSRNTRPVDSDSGDDSGKNRCVRNMGFKELSCFVCIASKHI